MKRIIFIISIPIAIAIITWFSFTHKSGLPHLRETLSEVQSHGKTGTLDQVPFVQAGDFMVGFLMKNNIATKLYYIKGSLPLDATATPPRLTGADIKTILAANSEGLEWSTVPFNIGLWARADGAAFAKYNKTHHSLILSIEQPNY